MQSIKRPTTTQHGARFVLELLRPGNLTEPALTFLARLHVSGRDLILIAFLFAEYQQL